MKSVSNFLIRKLCPLSDLRGYSLAELTRSAVWQLGSSVRATIYHEPEKQLDTLFSTIILVFLG